MINPYGTPQGAQNLGMGGNAYGGSNPYLQQNINSAMSDVTRQYQNTVAPQRAGAMAASGSFGNSGQQAMQLEDQRNLGQTLANTSGQMRMADYTQQQAMYQQDQQNNLANRSLDQQGRLANRGMDISSRGQDLSYNLGMAGNDTQRYGINTSANTATRGQDVSERVANAQNQTQRYGMDQQAATTRYGQDQSFNLGLRQNDLGFAGLDANIANSNFQNQLAGANFGLNAYNTLQNGNNMGLQAGTQIQNTPMDYQNQYNNQVNAMAGGRGGAVPQIQAQQSSPLTGALGGLQLYNAFNQSMPPPVVQGSNPYGYNGTMNNPSAYVG